MRGRLRFGVIQVPKECSKPLLLVVCGNHLMSGERSN